MENSGNITFHMEFPDCPQLREVKDEDLILLSYSAKHVANCYFELIMRNYDWDRMDIDNDTEFEMYMSFAGLTCEIYFKSILFYNDGISAKQRKIHDLKKLYDKLNTCRADIAAKIVEETCSGDIDMFSAELERIKIMFEQFRYSYELNGYRINIMFIKLLLFSLKRITDSECSE